MKNPHDQTQYAKAEVDSTDANQQVLSVEVQNQKARTKQKFSGAYYYVGTDERKLSKAAFMRNMLTVAAYILQIVPLSFPQSGAEYVTIKYPSYAYAYALFTIVGVFGVSIWLIIMNAVRYKLIKRIPAEWTPRGGFKRRVYFGTELYIATNAIMFVFELSFVCICYDGWGLVAMFLCALATVAAVFARQITHTALKNSESVPGCDGSVQ